MVNHHLTEEELTILNPARTEVGDRLRGELGQAFATERNSQIDDGCGSLTQVRKLVAEARREGLLDDEDDDRRTERLRRLRYRLGPGTARAGRRGARRGPRPSPRAGPAVRR